MTTDPASAPAAAYIAFGSNLGDRLSNMLAALELLVSHDCVTCMAQSSLYETAPVGGPPGQGPYLNGVVAVRTTLTPEALLAHCQTIESKLGRIRAVIWGPRTIDLDLLLFGDVVVQTDNLILPHPRMHERGFVLVPLAEIAPDVIHPVLRCNSSELLRRRPDVDGNLHCAYRADWSTPATN